MKGEPPLRVIEGYFTLMKGERNKGQSNKGEWRVLHSYEGWIKQGWIEGALTFLKGERIKGEWKVKIIIMYLIIVIENI